VHWLVAIERREDRRLVIAYGVLAALLFYVHYIDVFIILAFCSLADSDRIQSAAHVKAPCRRGLAMVLISREFRNWFTSLPGRAS